jgi:hypothetical protein
MAITEMQLNKLQFLVKVCIANSSIVHNVLTLNETKHNST